MSLAIALALVLSARTIHLAQDSSGLSVAHVQGNVYMIVGGGGNTTVQVGDQGVLIVDAKLETASSDLLETIAQLSDGPIRHVINTHFHDDHTGGNGTLASAGSTTEGEDTPIIAHENVLLRMSAPTGTEAPTLPERWPNSTFFGRDKELFFNGEAIQVLYKPAAHTDGDSIVFFRRSDVVSAGDVLNMTRYPVIDEAGGGSVSGVVDALNAILDMVIPAHQQEGGTMVIPGHGRLADEHDVLEYRDMIAIVRDRVATMIDEGMTLEAILASEPTLDYDARWGTADSFWSPRMFVEAVYNDVIKDSP